ncbi:unnamed protein product [Amoebophrya sp. A120]|nr:unnamed protein product [Amoebophrya sp. A120]|eukprot:GSA120T00008242001.1
MTSSPHQDCKKAVKRMSQHPENKAGKQDEAAVDPSTKKQKTNEDGAAGTGAPGGNKAGGANGSKVPNASPTASNSSHRSGSTGRTGKNNKDAKTGGVNAAGNKGGDNSARNNQNTGPGGGKGKAPAFVAAGPNGNAARRNPLPSPEGPRGNNNNKGKGKNGGSKGGAAGKADGNNNKPVNNGASANNAAANANIASSVVSAKSKENPAAGAGVKANAGGANKNKENFQPPLRGKVIEAKVDTGLHANRGRSMTRDKEPKAVNRDKEPKQAVNRDKEPKGNNNKGAPMNPPPTVQLPLKRNRSPKRAAEQRGSLPRQNTKDNCGAGVAKLNTSFEKQAAAVVAAAKNKDAGATSGEQNPAASLQQVGKAHVIAKGDKASSKESPKHAAKAAGSTLHIPALASNKRPRGNSSASNPGSSHNSPVNSPRARLAKSPSKNAPDGIEDNLEGDGGKAAKLRKSSMNMDQLPGAKSPINRAARQSDLLINLDMQNFELPKRDQDDELNPKFGMHTLKGKRETNEDAHIHIMRFSETGWENAGLYATKEKPLQLYGCFDGHGGPECAKWIANKLPGKLREYLDLMNQKKTKLDPPAKDVDKVKYAFSFTFEQLDIEYISQHMKSEAGCTAVVCLLDQVSQNIFCANVGDSRAIIGRSKNALAISRDHDPKAEGEKQRVQAVGTVDPDGYVNDTVNMTRCLGDRQGKFRENKGYFSRNFALATSPEVYMQKITEVHQFVLLCCDGMFESPKIFTSGSLCSRARELLLDGKSVKQVPKILCSEAIAKGSEDNCTVMMVLFDNPQLDEIVEENSKI